MPSFRPDPFAFLTGRLSAAPRPEAITPPGGGGKFTPAGEVLPFPGNTVLCHVDPASEAHAALRAMQAALRAGPLASAFAFLPPPSFHMTVMQGLSASVTRPADRPEGVTPGMPRDAVSRLLLARLAGVAAPPRARIASRGLFGGFSLTVEGADAAEAAALRQTRAALRAAAGVRHAGPDTYTFHITLAYPLRWLTDTEARAQLDLADRLHREFAARVPEIVLGRPEFCDFEDMLHFERRAWIGAPEPAADPAPAG